MNDISNYMKEQFRTKDKKKIQEALWSYIVGHNSLDDYDKALSYCEKEVNLQEEDIFDEYVDNILGSFDSDEQNWTVRYRDKLIAELPENFCKKRIENIRDVVDSINSKYKNTNSGISACGREKSGREKNTHKRGGMTKIDNFVKKAGNYCRKLFI